MGAGGRRPNSNKPRVGAVPAPGTRELVPPLSPLLDQVRVPSPKASGRSLTIAQHRVQMRETFQQWMTPGRLRELLTRTYQNATQGTNATTSQRDRDLLLRMGLGNPAVWGQTAEGETDGTEADALRALIASLPDGVTLILPPGVDASELEPGAYTPPQRAPSSDSDPEPADR